MIPTRFKLAVLLSALSLSGCATLIAPPGAKNRAIPNPLALRVSLHMAPGEREASTTFQTGIVNRWKVAYGEWLRLAAREHLAGAFRDFEELATTPRPSMGGVFVRLSKARFRFKRRKATVSLHAEAVGPSGTTILSKDYKSMSVDLDEKAIQNRTLAEATAQAVNGLFDSFLKDLLAAIKRDQQRI